MMSMFEQESALTISEGVRILGLLHGVGLDREQKCLPWFCGERR